ncbi:MAG: AAA family ATPase [Vulcanimicrobiota bacterium]
MSSGLLIAKFMPPHEGHKFLVDFANRYVEDNLTLVLSVSPEDTIPKERRLNWLHRLFPEVKEIVAVEQPLSEESLGQWVACLQASGRPFDYLFAPQRLGRPLARELSAHLVTLDPPFASLELESKAIRSNPVAHWNRLPAPIRQDFLKRVCVFGPESTGKTRLCNMLAQHYQTLAVPEYSRAYLEQKDGEYEADDIIHVARGQRAWEYAYSRRATRVLFCDTDMVTMKIWSEWLFKKCHPWVEEQIEKSCYDLYLLTCADVPWVEDDVRYLPNDRKNFQQACEQALDQHGCKYVKISGDWDVRFKIAVQAVDILLSDPWAASGR